MHKTIAVIGAFNALLSIALGAFLAHALRSQLAERMQSVFRTAVEYHTWHALGLILLALAYAHLSSKYLVILSAQFMIAGLILFCGSLYILAVTEIRWLGAITPFGGVSFMIAWAVFIWAIVKHQS
jgi:uncharacterized membrane protein YgdD (TMEM256/DUF423 family)